MRACIAGSEAFSSKNPALSGRPAGVGEWITEAASPPGMFIDEPGLKRRNRDKGVVFGGMLPHPACDLAQDQDTKSDNVQLSKGDCYE